MSCGVWCVVWQLLGAARWVQGHSAGTFSNWWTRKMPRVSFPWAPASFLKHVEYPAYRIGSSFSSIQSCLCKCKTDYLVSTLHDRPVVRRDGLLRCGDQVLLRALALDVLVDLAAGLFRLCLVLFLYSTVSVSKLKIRVCGKKT